MSNRTNKKIALIGLSNAGKTSIIKTFKHEFDIIQDLFPTHGVEYNIFKFLDREFNIWDYGGQEIYRKRYLNDPQQYFTEVSILLYTVDVQDINMLDKSIVYFNSIYKSIKNINKDIEIYILFHKADPGAAWENLKIPEKFLKSIKEQDGIEIKEENIFYTSIYNTLSVIRAISRPITKELNIEKNLQDILHKFAEIYKMDFLMLFTSSFFILAFDSPSKIGFREIDNILKNYFGYFLETNQLVYEEDSNHIRFYYENMQIIGETIQISIKAESSEKNPVFYLMGGLDSSGGILGEDEMKKLIKELAENLKKLMSTMDLSKFF